MAIQNRRGAYTDFDPTKMKPGEYGIVLSGDPNTVSGVSVYICTATGTVKPLVLREEAYDMLEAILAEEPLAELDQDGIISFRGS